MIISRVSIVIAAASRQKCLGGSKLAHKNWFEYWNNAPTNSKKNGEKE